MTMYVSGYDWNRECMSCPNQQVLDFHITYEKHKIVIILARATPILHFPIARVRISSSKHAADVHFFPVLLAASLILKWSDTKRNWSSVSKGACHIHNGHQGIRKSSTQNRCSQANFLFATHFAHWFWQVAWNIKSLKKKWV